MHINLHNHYHLKQLFKRELFEIYFLLTLRYLSTFMVGIFIPLYLFVELSYTLNQVIFFYLVWLALFTVFLFPGVKATAKYGAKHAMLICLPFFMLSTAGILILPDYPILFFPIAILKGIELVFFWTGFHIDAALHGRKKDLGKQSALISFMAVLPGVIGPVAGGLIIQIWGFIPLFIITLLLGSIAFIPLFTSRETYAKTNYEFKDFYNKEHLKYFLAYYSQGLAHASGAIFWPILIFTILGSYLSLGVYATFASIFIGIFGLIFGQLSDEGWKNKLIKISAFFRAIFWTLKAFVTSTLQVFGIGTLAGLSSLGIRIPLLAKTYSRARKEKVAGFVLFRELSIRAGQFTALLAVLAIGDIKIAFILTAISSIFFFLF